MDVADDTTKDTSGTIAQPIKRSAFVYGKRKKAELEQLDTTTHSPAAERLPSSLHTQDTTVDTTADRAPPSITDRVPQCLSDEESDDPQATSHFQFSFRRQMKEIDDGFDSLDEQLPQISRTDVQRVAGAMDSTSPLHGRTLTSEGPSGGSLSPPRPSPSPATASSLDDSPIISRRAKGRAKRPAVSDSESDPPTNLSSVSPLRHSLNTPDLRSPPTPPTSEFEMTTTKKSSKARGKAPVRGVPPLTFNSEDLPTNPFSGSDNKGTRKEGSGQRFKTKAPTKKERRDAALESSRIAASRPVEVPRTEHAKYTKASFFARVQNVNPGARIPNTSLTAELPSDPIEKFSSPMNPSTKGSLFGKPTGLLEGSALGTDGQGFANAAESSSDDMPPIGHIIRQEHVKPKLQELRQSLQAKKLALLKSQTGPSNDADDDELEIIKGDMHSVAHEAVAKRRADKSQRSPAKMKVLAMAIGRKRISKVPDGGSKQTSLPMFSEQQLKHFAKPVFARGSRVDKEAPRKQDLDRMMMRQHEQEKLRFIKQREEEWIQKGGRVLREGESSNAQASLSQVVETYAHRVLQAAEEAELMDSGASDDESDDGDYIPGSPSAQQGSDNDNDREEHSMTVSDPSAQLTDDEENVAPLRRKSGIRKSARIILGSDDEGSEQPAQSSTFVSPAGGQDTPRHCGPASSIGSQTEDENDKENNTKLMFDRSEDKENKAVIRHSPALARPALGLRVEPLFSLEGSTQRSSSVTSPENYDHMVVSQEIIRTPLKELPREDDDPFLQPASAPRHSFTDRLLRSVPSTPPRTISSPKQGLGSPATSRSERSRRHSLISSEGGNDENDVPGSKSQPLLLPFMETSVKRSPEARLMPFNAMNRGLSQFFSDDDGPRKVSSPNSNELSLTLDVRLQPALEVSSTLRRKADVIFEKEQEYVVAAAQKEQRPKEVLYVNDHGFLTQTRPEGSSPQVYHMTPSQASRYLGTQVDATQRTAERVPLRTLSFAITPGSPELRPLRRLRRRSASPLHCTAHLASLEPAAMMAHPSKVNAFDVLGKASNRTKAPKERLKDSEFVAAEAEESDEDDMFGFGGPKKDDDDEQDEEDEDAVVKELVDDNAMDVETERPDLVQEKFREHEAEDDQKLEKFHQEVVEGKYRKKRLGRGVNMDEDSDDEEDDGDRRIRQRMNKKRKIDGDDLEALGQNEETRAFYNTYHQDLVDDGDDEFKHLHGVPVESDGDDDPERESVTVFEVHERVREVARNTVAVKPLDPTNTDWIDESTEDDPVGVRVKVVSHQTTRTSITRRPNHSNVVFDVEAPKRSTENDSEQKQWISWAKDQGGRHYGTGRSATGAAVTGHAKVKRGGGSLRSKETGVVGNESRAGSSRLSKTPSMLSAVSDRSSKFG
ncbi:MRC1-like domain-containing protein [Pisolithus marmoratus]|nr:MRC1-like domain-containing protein [Pisolithus marmoratus]